MKKIIFILLICALFVSGCSFKSAYNTIKEQTVEKNNIISNKVDSAFVNDNVISNTTLDTLTYIDETENPMYPYMQIPHLDSALYYANISTKEVGNNAGFNNKYWQKKISEQGWRKGAQWCAYCVKTVLKMGNTLAPKTSGGLAQSFIKSNSVSANDVKLGSKQIGPGWILIWKHGTTYKGHVGLVYSWNKSSGVTVEGNTSSGKSGSQNDGDGVYIRKRTIQPRNYFRIVSFTKVIYETSNI